MKSDFAKHKPIKKNTEFLSFYKDFNKHFMNLTHSYRRAILSRK